MIRAEVNWHGWVGGWKGGKGEGKGLDWVL